MRFCNSSIPTLGENQKHEIGSGVARAECEVLILIPADGGDQYFDRFGGRFLGRTAGAVKWKHIYLHMNLCIFRIR